MKDQSKALSIESATPLPSTTNEMIFSPVHMQNMDAIANLMASGQAGIPDHFRGKPSDCLAVVMQACAWGMNPFQVARSTHIVSDTLGFEAKLVNAVISSSTAIEGRFHYDFSEGWERVAGKAEIQQVKKHNFKQKKDYTVQEPVALWDKADEEGLWVRVGATLRGEDKIQWGQKLFMSGVLVRNSPLWVAKPDQQMCYLALKYWSNLYTPSVTMGVHTPEELHSIDQPEREINPAGTTIKEMAAKATGEDALDNFDDAEPVEQARPAFQDIDKVLQDIAKAETLDALKKIGVYAAHVEGKYLEGVTTAYNARGKEIQTAIAEATLPDKVEVEIVAEVAEDDGNDNFLKEYDSVDSSEAQA